MNVNQEKSQDPRIKESPEDAIQGGKKETQIIKAFFPKKRKRNKTSGTTDLSSDDGRTGHREGGKA